MTWQERLSWVHRLDHKPGVTRFRVLPENPADERDRVLGVIRRRLWRRYYHGEAISRREAEDLLDILDEWHEGLTPRQVRRRPRFSTGLETLGSKDLKRLADFTGAR